jgi:hypothetical protein
MQISIRMIGIATTVFWIFLISFAVSAAYSVKDLQLDFGNPTATVTPDNQLLLSMSVNVLNRGYYDIDQFRVMMQISDVEGTFLANGSNVILFIPRGQPINSALNVTVETDVLFSQNSNLLFNDSELRINAAVGMRLAQLIPVEASSNFSIPWGAPFCGFSAGEPSFYDSTQLTAYVPVVFENHAFFELAGEMRIQMFNSRNLLVSQGETPINVPSGSVFNQSLILPLSSSRTPTSGRLEISFETAVFSHGPLVIPFG